MKTETFPLLRRAYQIIDGIPDTRIRLAYFSNGFSPHECDTIACAAGWLAMHPEFNALGLHLNCVGGIEVDGVGNSWGWDTRLAYLFEISSDEAETIFGKRAELGRMTDKQVWQARVRKFLKSKETP